MLSKYTYAFWNTAVSVLTILYAAGNYIRGTYWLSLAELIMSVVFLIFAVLAYRGKSIFSKHPTAILPNGDVTGRPTDTITLVDGTYNVIVLNKVKENK